MIAQTQSPHPDAGRTLRDVLAERKHTRGLPFTRVLIDGRECIPTSIDIDDGLVTCWSNAEDRTSSPIVVPAEQCVLVGEWPDPAAAVPDGPVTS